MTGRSWADVQAGDGGPELRPGLQEGREDGLFGNRGDRTCWWHKPGVGGSLGPQA